MGEQLKTEKKEAAARRNVSLYHPAAARPSTPNLHLPVSHFPVSLPHLYLSLFLLT